jgi:hypothetical protein
MKQMLDNNEDNRMRQRLEGLEIYIIPTANPEGLDVVHSGLDVTFRKNKRDNIGDGVLRISNEEGWDTSGVDINRNFSTHWDRGDTLFRPEASFRYNAYRGASPFSEPESRALRDLALSRQFLYSIVYHSSRSGANTELLIGPWYWAQNGEIKRPPDAQVINTLGETIADLMPVQLGPDTTYWYGQSTQRKGQLQDWFYIETGSIQYMAEIAADIHPDAEGMRQVVSEQQAAVWFLMDLALGLEGLDSCGTLTVISNPCATIVIDDETHPILSTRKTGSNGRFDWLLPDGQHSVTVKGLGYAPRRFENVDIKVGERTVLEVNLERQVLLAVPMMVRMDSPLDASEALLKIYDFRSDQLLYVTLIDTTESIGGLPLFPHMYNFVAYAGGHVPQVFSLDIRGEVPYFVNLPPADTAYLEDFAAMSNWPREGGGWGVTTFNGRTCLTESVVGDYPADAELLLELQDIVRLDSGRATLRIAHLPYTEPVCDYQQIEWWTNPEEVHTRRYSQLREHWDTLFVSLDNLEPGLLSVGFRVVSDGSIGEDGWLIDQVAVFTENFNASVSNLSPAPFALDLAPAFPNPFNSSTTINFSIPATSAVKISIYDLAGRLVKELLNGKLETGEHRVVWEAEDLGSGVYVMRLESGGSSLSQKIVMLR